MGIEGNQPKIFKYFPDLDGDSGSRNVTSTGNIPSPSTDTQLPKPPQPLLRIQLPSLRPARLRRRSPRPPRATKRSVCDGAQLAAPPSPIHRLPRWRAPNPNPFVVPLKQAALAATAKCPVPSPDLNCVEVFGPDGTPKRFALGTRASFVVDRFNKKLVDAVKPVVCVQAFKHGEEPVEFDPDAPLMSVCEWDLRVVQEAPFEPIRVGDKIPNSELSYLDDDGKLESYGIYDLVREKKAVFFGVPGAFTPTCSLKHVPGFLQRAEEMMDRGVKEIICVTVNDPWVVKVWEKTYPDNKHIKFLCDGSATWTKNLGLELDLIDRGMGVRSRRYCLLVDDTVVKIANVEEAGGLEISTADRMMADLEAIKGAGGGHGGC